MIGGVIYVISIYNNTFPYFRLIAFNKHATYSNSIFVEHFVNFKNTEHFS